MTADPGMVLTAMRAHRDSVVERCMTMLTEMGMVSAYLPEGVARAILSEHYGSMLTVLDDETLVPETQAAIRAVGQEIGRAGVPLSLTAAAAAAFPGVLRTEMVARGMSPRWTERDLGLDGRRVARAVDLLIEGWERGDAARRAAGADEPLGTLLQDLLAGRISSATGAVRIALAGLPEAPWHIGIAQGAEAKPVAREGVHVAVVPFRGDVAWIANTDEPFERTPSGLTGSSAAALSGELPRATVQATLAFAAAQRTGVSQSWGHVDFHDALAEHPGLLDTAAERLLLPLEPALRETLEVFARHWPRRGAAADALGIHRNTLARRLAAIEEQLRLDLSDGATLVRLYLATWGSARIDM